MNQEFILKVVEDKSGKDRVYTKWKPPKNKLTQEIQRKKGAKRKSIVPDSAIDRCLIALFSTIIRGKYLAHKGSIY